MSHDPEWTWQFASALLERAVGCGFECARVFVVDGAPEAPMPDGCKCQLTASIGPDGWTEKGNADPTGWGPARRIVEVRLDLMLCYPVPGPTQAVDPTAASKAARDASIARERILRGLREGAPPTMVSSVTWRPWQLQASEGGISHWQMVAVATG